MNACTLCGRDALYTVSSEHVPGHVLPSPKPAVISVCSDCCARVPEIGAEAAAGLSGFLRYLELRERGLDPDEAHGQAYP